ncbi:6,7-dimethyl-8-ribityllumazine synthase [Buchnera aphidicola]|uniref:6,7-dimethyl-8-ribityllumazine synthase n=1 Tax=Buchnera aphidicola TaxID=9 RepID=UPI0031B7F3C3
MKFIQSKLNSKNSKISIITTKFNEVINNTLLKGCIETLKNMGKINEKNITVIKIPGVYESSITAEILALKKKYNAIIVLGTIIKGNTRHHKFIERSISYGLSQVSLKNKIPITLGILMTKNINQAIERCGIKMNNKGSEAAIAALEMINILKKI